MNKRRGLGSGLDALLPGSTQAGGVREVATNSIQQNPRQPRTHFDQTALDELAASIREHGIIQPLIVSERAAGRYELIAGERRWRAAQQAGIDRVPVIVRESTPQQLLELALIENVQRADLNPIEEAHAYEELKEEFGLSDNDIARRLGRGSREAIANTRRLLKLVPDAQDALLKQQISAGHGRALLKLKMPEEQQKALEAMVKDDWTVREAERFGSLLTDLDSDIDAALATIRSERAARASNERQGRGAPQRQTSTRVSTLSAEDHDVKREIERILGTPVAISRSDKNLRVTIVFDTDEKLQEFFDLLNANSY
jgi:ParB family chromosome partitioning protein